MTSEEFDNTEFYPGLKAEVKDYEGNLFIIKVATADFELREITDKLDGCYGLNSIIRFISE